MFPNRIRLIPEIGSALLPDRIESSRPCGGDSQAVSGTGVLPIENVVHRDVLSEGIHRPTLLVRNRGGDPQTDVADLESRFHAADGELIRSLVTYNAPPVNLYSHSIVRVCRNLAIHEGKILRKLAVGRIRWAKDNLAAWVWDAGQGISLASCVEFVSLKLSLMAVTGHHHQVYIVAIQLLGQIGLYPGNNAGVIPELDLEGHVALRKSAVEMQGALHIPEVTALQREQVVVRVGGEDHAALLAIYRKQKSVRRGLGAGKRIGYRRR